MAFSDFPLREVVYDSKSDIVVTHKTHMYKKLEKTELELNGDFMTSTLNYTTDIDVCTVGVR